MIENRSRFGKVIICLTDMSIRDPDYRLYLKESLSRYGIIFLDIPRAESGQDWRNEAIDRALKVSDGDYVLFTEQDFLPTDNETFWSMVDCDLDDEKEVITVLQGDRWHPCFLLVKRDLLEKTSKDFGVVTDRLDHFGKFQQELEEINPKLSFIQNCWHHMNGLSQNLYLLQAGENPNYNPKEFKKYCEKCLELPDLHPDLKGLFEYYVQS